MDYKCQQCGAELPVFPGTCPKCHAFNGKESSAVNMPAEPGQGNTVLLNYPFATAWPRYLARTFDVFIEMIIVTALFTAIALPFAPGIAAMFFSLNAFVVGVIALPFALILDSLFHITVKNTPGKALLGLQVRDLHGNRLSPGKHFKRNSLVWVIGYWLGVPVLEIVPKILQYERVSNNKPSSYDEMMDVRVWARPGGFAGKVAFVVLSVFFVVLFFFGADYRYRTEGHALASVQSGVSGSPGAPSAPKSHSGANGYPYYWMNPVTHSAADIPSSWKIKEKYNSNGERYWMFSHASGRVIVFLAYQTVPGASIEDYELSYIKAHSQTMSYAKSGQFFEDHGYHAWADAAVLRSSSDVNEKIEILKKGNTFWRIAVFNAQASARDVRASNKLMSVLMSTVY